MSLNLFTLPAVDTTVKAYRMVPYNTAITGTTPVSFLVPGLDDYVDLGRSYLHIELKLKTAATNGLAADANSASDATNTKFVYVTNNIGHGLFKQMKLKFNGRLMSEATDDYAYRALLETVMNYDDQEGKTILAGQGWVNDSLNVVEKLEATGTNDDKITTASWAYNKDHPLKDATKPFHGNKTVTLIVYPHLAPMRTGRLLVPGVELGLDLYLNKPDFYMFGTYANGTQATGGTKKYVTVGPNELKVTLYLCRMTLNQSVYNTLQTRRRVKNRWANYPVVRTEIRTFSFDGNTTKFTQDNVFTGRVPDRILIGLLDSKAYNGDLEYYPYAFQSFGATRIRQIIDGEEYPNVPLELNSGDASKDFSGYHRFLQVCESIRGHRPNMVKPTEWGYQKNFTLFGFNNVPKGNADTSSYRNPKQGGNLRLELEFGSSPDKNITVLVLGEFENVYQINDQGGVLYNVHP